MWIQWSVFSFKFAAYFQNTFLEEHLWRIVSTSFCGIDENSKFGSIFVPWEQFGSYAKM